ncbi:LysE family translocator [Cohaesibacter sp. CAU 1516]|uniref:LysE family translocator n=1 Tax=Cohaesibacter sp. CAU 1516 TaxID=2576038 RepID=UPI0010FCF2FC|nr:LysE family translocator [Cohaesibacter sp. CAU 1516]TLP45484.1 LysE family translocator [Cohaesibacter sp. CAU 1516]
MFDHFPFVSVFLALAALTLTPGLDTVLVLRNAARGGVQAGVLTTLGICSGLFVHGTISALGLSLILLQSASLFGWMKFAGALFLIYLGAQSLLAAWRGETLVVETSGTSKLTGLRAFRDGFFTNLLNPKLIVFYMLFLPQFIDPASAALPQALLVAAIHFLLGMIWLSGLAAAVHGARRVFARPLMSRLLNGCAGILLIGFGGQLAVFERP